MKRFISIAVVLLLCVSLFAITASATSATSEKSFCSSSFTHDTFAIEKINNNNALKRQFLIYYKFYNIAHFSTFVHFFAKQKKKNESQVYTALKFVNIANFHDFIEKVLKKLTPRRPSK